MKRTPLARRTPLKVRTGLSRGKPLAPRSAKRKREAPARRRCRKDVLRRDGDRCTFPGCGARENLEVHEVRGGPDRARTYLIPGECRTLCHDHNQWVHDHPIEAHALGLWRWSWEQPE